MHPLLHGKRIGLGLPDDLQSLFVGENGFEWSFSPTEQRYYKHKGDELISRLRGSSLVNPEHLFLQRISRLGLARDDAAAQKYRPANELYQLWDDWKRRA